MEPVKANMLLLGLLAAALTLLSASVAFSAEAKLYESDLLNQLTVAGVTSLGAPLSTITIPANYVHTTADGEHIFYGGASGTPAVFFAYNLDTNEVLYTHKMEFAGLQSASVWAIDMDSEGMINIVCSSTIQYFRYNPQTNEMRGYGRVFTETNALHMGYVDAQDNYYFGTYPGAKLVKYDKQADKLVDLGRMFPGRYTKAVVGYKDTIYIGGEGEDAQLVKYDIATGTKTVVPAPGLRGLFYPNEVTGYSSATVTGKYMLMRVRVQQYSRSFSTLCVYDLESEEWINYLPEASFPYHTTQLEDGIIYYHGGNSVAPRKLMSYNPVTKAVHDTGIRVPNFMVNPQIVELKDQVRYPGKTIVAGAETDGIMLANLTTKKVELIKPAEIGQPTPIRALEAGPNFEVALSEYRGEKITIYDVNDRVIKQFGPQNQVESITYIDGKYYLGNYGSAQLIEYDPAKPGQTGVNPKIVAPMRSDVKQSRAFNIIDAGHSIIWGSVPGTELQGGAVGIYDKKFGSYRNYDIQQQSVSGLAYKDGKVYISTNIYGGLGKDGVDQTAQVIKMDFISGRFEKQIDVVLAKDRNRQYFAGDMLFSPDGSRLWLATAQTLVELDPDDLSIINEISIGRLSLSRSGTRWIPFSLAWTENGLLITSIGDVISAVDTDTLEVKVLHYEAASVLDIATNGHIYFVSSRRPAELMELRLKY